MSMLHHKLGLLLSFRASGILEKPLCGLYVPITLTVGFAPSDMLV